jgi:hypothetical protein
MHCARLVFEERLRCDRKIALICLGYSNSTCAEVGDTIVVCDGDCSSGGGCVCSGDFRQDFDVDGSDLAELINYGGIALLEFAKAFGRDDCP